jgi:hypothetical protein
LLGDSWAENEGDDEQQQPQPPPQQQLRQRRGQQRLGASYPPPSSHSRREEEEEEGKEEAVLAPAQAVAVSVSVIRQQQLAAAARVALVLDGKILLGCIKRSIKPAFSPFYPTPTPQTQSLPPARASRGWRPPWGDGVLQQRWTRPVCGCGTRRNGRGPRRRRRC